MKTQNTVTYIVQRPLLARDRQRFGIDFLLNRGHHVIIIDVGDIVLPELTLDRRHYAEFNDIEIFVPQSNGMLQDVQRAFEKSAVIFCFMVARHIKPKQLPILRLLKKARRPYLLSLASTFPGLAPDDGKGSFLGNLKTMARRALNFNIVTSVVGRLPIRMLGIAPAFAVIYGGKKSLMPSQLIAPTTKAIHAHAMDYDIYLNVRNDNKGRENTAVFLDQFYPFHQDRAAYGAKRDLEPNAYYACLRTLFTRLENAYGLRVVIAAHPRSRYEDFPDFFDGREIIRDDTARLVRDSRLVISHNSIAINFAVLFKKPVMLLTSKPMYDLHEWHRLWFDNISQALKTPLHYFDNPDSMDISSALSYDSSAYAAYETAYIKQSNTPDVLFWEIIIKKLSEFGVATL